MNVRRPSTSRISRVAALFAMALMAAGPITARADFAWFNSSTNLSYYADGLTPLYGVKDSNTVSCFVQLIYAGADDTIDVAQYLSDGSTGDDVVVAWSYIASNVPGASGSTSHYGRVNGGTFTAEVANEYYYVRVWTAPSPDFGLGLAPTSASNFYGNSVMFQALGGFEPPALPQNFNFGGEGGIVASLVPVPEPGTWLLLALSFTALLARRIRMGRA